MVLSTKQKRTLNIILIVALMAIILSGIGLGIYFICKDKVGLTVRQKNFGANVNLSSSQIDHSEIDLSHLSFDVDLNNVSLMNDNYLVSVDGETSVYDLTTGNKVNINSLILYDEIKELCGKVLVVSEHGVDKLIDLTTGNLICGLTNASYFYNKSHLVALANKGDVLKYVSKTTNETDCVLVLFDVNTCEPVLEIKKTEKVIDISLSDNYLSVSFKEKTDLYQLNNFKLLKTLSNEGEQNLAQYNIQSELTDDCYLMSSYQRVFELSENVCLIEKAELVSNKEDGTVSNLDSSNNLKHYKLTYQVYDFVSGELFELESNNKVLKPINVKIHKDYFAVLSYNVDDNKNINKNNVEISYYMFDKNKNGDRAVYSIVSYDYLKNGVICSFNGQNLITKGGLDSKPISFSGKEDNNIDLAEGSKLDGTNNKNVVIETTVLGQKRILSNYGKVLVDGVFLNVSPFDGNFAIAKDSENYYLVSISGKKEKINNFAKEFEDVVFAGIGLYFTKGANNLYSVYNLEKTPLYENVGLKTSYNSLTNELLIFVNGEEDKFIKVQPKVNNLFKVEDFDGGVYGFLPNSIKNATQNNESSNTEDVLESESLVVDETFKNAQIDYDLTFTISKIKDKFKNYNELSASQKALIPAFDDAQNLSYLSNDKLMTFAGAYYVSDDVVTIAVIALECEGNSYYLVNIAIKNAYLKNAKVSYNKSALTKTIINGEIKNADLDFSKNYMPAVSLKGVGVTCFDSEVNNSRMVDYVGAGFDGGLVFATGKATKINVDFTLSNIYVGLGFESETLKLNEQVKDYGKYSVKVFLNGNKTFAQIIAKEGYFITGFEFSGYASVASTYESINEVYKNSVNKICSSFIIDVSKISSVIQYISFNKISLVERYSCLEFRNYDNSIIDSAYYFYGYGSDLNKSNPAYLGFDNFNRKQSVKNPTYRIGYDYNGYSVNGNLVVNKQGVFVGNISDFNFDYSLQEPTITVLAATYTAKEFHLYFVNGTEPLPGEERAVKFDSVIGALPSVDKVGYDLKGWFDPNGNAYTESSLYNVDGNLTLTAVWKAEEYELVFDNNIKEYFGLNVNGYDYFVKNAQFTRKFQNFNVGSNFSNVSKTITYDSVYGELPYIMGYGNNQDIYMFVGWFENSSAADKGREYTNSNKVTLDSARTLYAHYTKEIYSVKLKITGAYIDKLNEIRCSGATVNGEASSFSTISGNAENLLVFVDNEVVLYTLQSKMIHIGVDLLPGYHVKEMIITYAGDKYVYDESALSPSGKNFSFTDTESAAGNITVKATNENGYSLNVGMVVSEGQPEGDADAEIEIETEETTYTTTINLTSPKRTDINGNVNEQPDNQLAGYELFLFDAYYNKDKTDGGKTWFTRTDSDFSFASEARYTFNPNDENGVQSSYLKELKIKSVDLGLERVLRFNLEYRNDTGEGSSESNKIIHDLREESLGSQNQQYDYYVSLLDSEGVVTTVNVNARSQTYSFEGYTVYVHYNLYTRKYTYELFILTTENYEVDAIFENTSSNITVNEKNVEEVQGSKTQITDINKRYYYSKRIDPIKGYAISSVKLTYGSVISNQEVFYTNFEFDSLSDIYLVQENSNETYLSSSVGKIQINGSNIVLEAHGKELEIVIKDAICDVTIDVEYVKYQIVEIKSDRKKDLWNKEILYGAEGSEKNANFTTETGGEFNTKTNLSLEKFITYENEDDNIYFMLFIGSWQRVVVCSHFNENKTFIIQSENSYIETTQENDSKCYQAKINKKVETGGEFNINIRLFEREFSFASYVGIDSNKESFVVDDGNFPKTNSGLIMGAGQFKSTFYEEVDNEFKLTTLTYAKEMGEGELAPHIDKKYTGRHLKFEFPAELDGGRYKLNYDKSGLYDPIRDELLGDSFKLSDNQTSKTYDLTELSDHSTVEFRIYYDVTVFYNIEYKYHIKGGSETPSDFEDKFSGLFLDSNHVYNVWPTLSKPTRELFGYNFIGYSLENDDDCEYPYDEKEVVIDNNLATTNGAKVYIYCLFEPIDYKITFDLNKGLGSSDIDSECEDVSIKYDAKFESLPSTTRVGYSFMGWATKADEGEIISSSTTFNQETYNKLTINESNKTITLYARWQAKEYSIIFDTNKGAGSSNPAAVSGTYKVVFDGAFSEMPTTYRTGYEFKGWKTNLETGYITKIEQGVNFDFELYSKLIEKNESDKTIKLFAIWQVKTFSLNLKLDKIIKNDLVSKISDTELRADAPIFINGVKHTNSATLYYDINFDQKLKSVIPTNVSVTGYQTAGIYYEYNGSKVSDSTALTVENNIDVYMRMDSSYINTYDFEISVENPNGFEIVYDGGNIVDFGSTKEVEFRFTDDAGDVGFLKNFTINFNGVPYEFTFGWDPKEKFIYIEKGYPSGVADTPENQDIYFGVIDEDSGERIGAFNEGVDVKLTSSYVELMGDTFNVIGGVFVKEYYVSSEEDKFIDTNENGVWDDCEILTNDRDGDGEWDRAEPFTDTNGNGTWDSTDEFTDTNGNGVWDEGEILTNDHDGDGEWDPAELFADTNGNGTWDAADEFTDANGNGVWDDGEELIYDHDGDGEWDPAWPRINIKFDFIKTNTTLTDAQLGDKFFIVQKFYQLVDSNGVSNPEAFAERGSVLIKMNTNVSKELEPYYIAGYTFVGWFYEDGSQVSKARPIKNNTKIIAKYIKLEQGQEHKVTYYHWNGTEYVARYSEILVSDGQYFNSTDKSTMGGRPIKMPSPATELWPTGYYFAGFVIKGEKPTTMLTSRDINSAADRNAEGALFDVSNMVDSELHVYAVYDEFEFRATSGNDVVIKFGEILQNGTVYKFKGSDVTKTVYINDINKYNEYVNDGVSKEAALALAGYNFESGKYKVAVIFKNPDGSYGYDEDKNSYIFAVSTNYVELN